MIPSSFLPDSVFLTMKKSKEAIKRRLEGSGHVIREGAPDGGNLPDEPIAVWLRPLNTRKNREASSFNGEAFESMWAIEYVVRDSSSDVHATSLDEAMEVGSDLIESLTSTRDDTSLDNTVDFTTIVDVNYDVGPSVSGGDQNLVHVMMTLLAMHPMFPSRC